MQKMIPKIIVGFFATLAILSLSFTIFQIFQSSPQLTEIVKDFLVYISINLFSVIGLSMSLYFSNEKTKQKMEDLYEELMDLNNEDSVIFAKFEELALQIIRNPQSANNKQTRDRIEELMTEYNKIATKSEKAMLKLLGKIVKKETKK